MDLMDGTVSNASADSGLLPRPGIPEVLIPKYSDDDVKYLGALQIKLEHPRPMDSPARELIRPNKKRRGRPEPRPLADQLDLSPGGDRPVRIRRSMFDAGALNWIVSGNVMQWSSRRFCRDWYPDCPF